MNSQTNKKDKTMKHLQDIEAGIQAWYKRNASDSDKRGYRQWFTLYVESEYKDKVVQIRNILPSVKSAFKANNYATFSGENWYMVETKLQAFLAKDIGRDVVLKKESLDFKKGEWVTVNDSEPKQFKRFTKHLPEWNKSLDYENVEMMNNEKFHVPNFDRSIVKKWIPKQDDEIICLDQPTPRIFEVNDKNIRFVIDEFNKKRVIPYIGQSLKGMK